MEINTIIDEQDINNIQNEYDRLVEKSYLYKLKRWEKNLIKKLKTILYNFKFILDNKEEISKQNKQLNEQIKNENEIFEKEKQQIIQEKNELIEKIEIDKKNNIENNNKKSFIYKLKECLKI